MNEACEQNQHPLGTLVWLWNIIKLTQTGTKKIDSLHILNLVCHFFIITCLPQSSMVLSQGLDQVSSSLNSRKNKPLSFHMTMMLKTLLTRFLWAMLLVNIIVGQLLVQTFTVHLPDNYTLALWHAPELPSEGIAWPKGRKSPVLILVLGTTLNIKCWPHDRPYWFFATESEPLYVLATKQPNIWQLTPSFQLYLL